MRIDWCWACRKEHPMLDDREYAVVWEAFMSARRSSASEPDTGESPRERLLKLQALDKPVEPPKGLTPRQVRY